MTEYWACNEPVWDDNHIKSGIIGNRIILMTEEDIIKFWRNIHPEYVNFSDQVCLEDYITIHWAWKVTLVNVECIKK